MARGIKLSRAQVQNAVHGSYHVFRVEVSVADVAGGMDPNVFVFQRSGPDLLGNYTDYFQTVASPVDMADLPVHTPNLTVSPFFRKDVIEVDFPAQAAYDFFWTTLVELLNRLCVAMDMADFLSPASTVTIGEFASESLPVSQSESV